MSKSIQNENELVEAVKYVALETLKMALKIVGKTFPIKSVAIFAHSQLEYELLVQIQENMGKPLNYHNGPRVELYNPIEVGNNKVIHLRIRKPDINRPQVGCNDFDIDYKSFKRDFLSNYPNNLRLIKRPEYEMIEFHDPSFDVLAYVVSIKNPYGPEKKYE